MGKLEDLQALGKMLDEGKIDRSEYERLKVELLEEDEPVVQANPMEGKPPGWYSDPVGAAQHQAYWDGEGWTGQTRTQFQAKIADPKPVVKTGQQKAVSRRNRRALLIIAAVLVAAIAIAGMLEGGGSVGSTPTANTTRLVRMSSVNSSSRIDSPRQRQPNTAIPTRRPPHILEVVDTGWKPTSTRTTLSEPH